MAHSFQRFAQIIHLPHYQRKVLKAIIHIYAALLVLPVDIFFQYLLKVTDQTKNWVDALESKICSECGYDFTDTAVKKGHLGLIKNDIIIVIANSKKSL